jgi:hypothetical protein
MRFPIRTVYKLPISKFPDTWRSYLSSANLQHRMSIQQDTKLNTGAIMPLIGLGIITICSNAKWGHELMILFRLIHLGTWKSQPGQAEHAVEIALRNGYRHIDTATDYGWCYRKLMYPCIPS